MQKVIKRNLCKKKKKENYEIWKWRVLLWLHSHSRGNCKVGEVYFLAFLFPGFLYLGTYKSHATLSGLWTWPILAEEESILTCFSPNTLVRLAYFCRSFKDSLKYSLLLENLLSVSIISCVYLNRKDWKKYKLQV